MRIGIDARHLPEGRGVARYLQRTLGALVALHPEDEWIALVPGSTELTLAPALADALRVPPPRAGGAARDAGGGLRLVRTRWPGRVLFAAGAALGRPSLERLCGGALDAVWMPAPAPIGLDGSAPLVLTVHDLSFEQRPGDFTVYERAWHRAGRLARLARRATRVVAVSGPTRDLAIERWHVDPQRVEVVHEGADAPPGRRACGDLTTTSVVGSPHAPYLLCVGALEPRKAPELLAGAYARARARGLEAELVLAGAGRLAARLEGRPGLRLVGAVDEAHLDDLYRGALAVVSPSWIEGFGLTPLEALAHGVPPVVSDLPVYDETLGPGALRFPVGDAAALADALLRIAGDAALRERIVAAGRTAIAPLTWEACARGIRAALERAAGA